MNEADAAFTSADSRVAGPGELVLSNVSKAYETRRGKVTVFRDINLRIRRGERVGILGRNGSGKSTLIRIMGNVTPPTTGIVSAGMSVSWPLAFGGAVQGGLTGLDNLKFICRVYGIDIEEARPFVEKFAELGHYFREPVQGYSSGMRARLAFALSLAVDFDCILIDEVIAVGDQRFRDRCTQALFDKTRQRAMVLVSHNEDMIRHYTDRAFVLVSGVLHAFDEIEAAIAYYNETLFL
jgi:capsular polysaccharide transport system ATP-binding protein